MNHRIEGLSVDYNGIPPEWLDTIRASGGPYCDPEWKLSAANPEWKRIMERNEWRPPTNE